MDNFTLTLFLSFVFASVFLLMHLFVAPILEKNFGEHRELKQRINSIHKYGRVIDDQSLLRDKYLHDLSPTKRILIKFPVIRGIDDLIMRTGKSYSFNSFVIIMFAIVLLTGIIANYYSLNIFISCAVILIMGYLPIIKLKNDGKKRIKLFENQLPDALDTMSRGLRSGYPFTETMLYISTEMTPPISSEFGITFEEINYGRDIRVAFNDFLIRTPSINLSSVITAILIQQETGGNLAELLDKTSSLLRKRIRFERSIQTLTAENRLSAWFLGLLPFIVLLLISLMSPSYTAPLFNTDLGHKMLGVGLVLEAIGAFWMYKLIDLDI